MKKLLLLATLFVVFFSQANAQLNSCVPDPKYKDSLFGVFPRPYDPVASPKGGIDKSACIGKPYKFVFTGIVPDTLNVTLFGNQLKLKVDSLVLDKKNGAAISGLPKGISWDCQGGKCKLLPKTQSCIVLFGTADATNAAKDYELKITMKAYVQTFLGQQAVDVNFPDPSLSPGKYILKVEPNTSKNCFVVGNEEQYLNVDKIYVSPNPTLGDAKIIFSAKEDDNFEYMVTDMNGKILQRNDVKVNAGWNEIPFAGNELPEGVYMYYLGNGKGRIANRIVISR